MKNILAISMITILFLSCGKEKQIVKAPNVNLDPKFDLVKPLDKTGDPKLRRQWPVKTNGLEKVWENYSSSSSLKIAIVGTGIDYNHPDLQVNIVRSKNKLKKEEFDVGIDLVDNDSLAYDHYGHDTKLVGIISAAHNNGLGIKGVLGKASIFPIRYINENGRSNAILLHKALTTLLELKPSIALINLPNLVMKTKEIDHSTAIKAVLKKLEAAKIPLVIGAGNFASEMKATSKVREVFSQFSNVVVVTGHDKKKKKVDLANYSTTGVHTSAPSELIMTTVKGGKYELASGTDLAAAYVTAALGLAISEYSNKHSLKDLIDSLMRDEASDTNSDMKIYTLGRNNLNIEKYLNYLSK